MVNLDLYRVFYTVAKKGSLTKAAEELYISQPAVSQSVKQLENQLGVTLFNRTHRGMTLSEEGGMRIVDKVERALRLLEEAEKEVGETGGQKRGEIRLSAPEEVVRYVLADKIAAFAKKFPSVRIRLTNVGEEGAADAVRLGEVDAAITLKPCLCSSDVLAYSAGIDLKCVYLGGKKYAEKLESVRCGRAARGKTVEEYAEKNVPLIAASGEDECGAVISGVSTETAKELAASGAGAVLMPEIYAKKEIDEGRLFVLPMTPPRGAEKRLFIAVSTKKEKEKLLAAFLSVAGLACPSEYKESECKASECKAGGFGCLETVTDEGKES